MRRAAVALSAWFLAAPILAVEAAHEEAHVETWLGIPSWIFWTINLIVFFGLIAYFAGPAVVQFFDDKRRQIRHDLERAEEQRAEAEEMEVRLASQIASLKQEIDELRERAESEGEREREEIIAEAERERKRLVEQTESEISQRLREARRELSEHAAELAGQIAESRLDSGLTEADRERVVERNLARLEGLERSR